MNMNKKTISPYNIALTILAICLCLVLSFAILTPSLQVFADYSDLPENTIVNFNQIINPSNNVNTSYYTYNNGTYNFNVITNWININQPINIISGHKYYVCFNSNTNNTRVSLTNNIDYGILNSLLPVNTIIEPTETRENMVLMFNGNNQSFSSTGYIIDLTLMFGENNIPSLQECQELFTADYYNYTTGTQMPLSKSYMQGYQDGANDIWESLTTTYNNDILGTITTPSTIGGFESNVAYDSQYSRYLVEGLAQLDFGATITSQVNYKGTFWISGYTGGVYVVFFKYEGSVLTPLIVSEITEAPSNVQNATPYCDITFNINNVQQIYFGFFTSQNTFNNDTSTTMYCWTSELQLNTIDVALLIQSSYTRGVIETTKEYSEGGSKYDSIYNLGKAEGIAEYNGYATGLDVIATTFTQVFSIFNIEILPGIPLTIFILLPLLVGLIFFIVKMTKGD